MNVSEPCMIWREGGQTNLLGLAVDVEGQTVEALVMLREAAQAEEDTHVHQHAAMLSREGLGHLDHLWRGIWPPRVAAPPIACRSLGGWPDKCGFWVGGGVAW